MPGDSMGGSMGGSRGGGDTGGGDSNQGGVSGDGDGDGDDNDDDGSDSMPKDAPLTTGTLTAGGDSDGDDDEDDDSERENDSDNDNDNEPTSKDAPVTTDTLTAKKIDCPKGQEVSLFSTSCEPIGGVDSTMGPTSSDSNTITNTKPPFGTAPLGFPLASPEPDNQPPDDTTEGQEQPSTEGSNTLGDFLGIIPKDDSRDEDKSLLNPLNVPGSLFGPPDSSKKNTDGTKTDIYKQFDGRTIEVTRSSSSTQYITKDKDQNLLSTQIIDPKGGYIVYNQYNKGNPSLITRTDSNGNIVDKTYHAPDDSYSQTLSYNPGHKEVNNPAPAKIVTNYRDPPGRTVTETFDGNVRKIGEYNPKDGGWTTTKATDQRTGITTTEITKTNPDGSVSTKNPDTNAITTQNKDGSWFISFPPSSDGSVKTYHSDGRTTIEKPK